MENKQYFETMVKLVTGVGGERYLHKIGEGFSRVVYDIEGTDYVLKVAKTGFGIAQSSVEFESFTKDIFNGKQVPILYTDKDHEIMIVAKAEPHHCDRDDNNIEWDITDSEHFTEDEVSMFFKELEKPKVRNFGFVKRDLVKTSSWGKYLGKNVLLDCGYGSATYDLDEKICEKNNIQDGWDYMHEWLPLYGSLKYRKERFDKHGE